MNQACRKTWISNGELFDRTLEMFQFMPDWKSICLGLVALITIPGFSTVGKSQTNNLTSLFDGKTLDGWIQIPPDSWTVTNGVLADKGTARGVLYTKNDYSHYRLMFTVRHVSGTNPDHMACVLFFCTRPEEGKKPLDALGAVQFQPPPGYGWDYRPGHNNDGKGEFTSHPHPKFDPHEWSRVEILVDASKGTARMAVAQPPGSKAVEVVDFSDPTAGKAGPIAWQIHNKGLFDEYKEVTVEVDPKDDELITVN